MRRDGIGGGGFLPFIQDASKIWCDLFVQHVHPEVKEVLKSPKGEHAAQNPNASNFPSKFSINQLPFGSEGDSQQCKCHDELAFFSHCVSLPLCFFAIVFPYEQIQVAGRTVWKQVPQAGIRFTSTGIDRPLLRN